MFSRKEIVHLLIPLIIEQTLSITIGLFDTMMVSGIGEAAVSGVSLIDSFNTLILQVLAALAIGGSVVVSQCLGKKDMALAKRGAAQIILCVLSFSSVVALVVIFAQNLIIRGIYGSIDADVMAYARTYFMLSAFSYPFMGLYNVGTALFRAQGNSKISMVSSLVMNVTNISGNYFLIYICHMGVAGAAIASLVSRAIACITVMVLLQKRTCPLRVDSLHALYPDGKIIRSILSIGIPSGIENGMFQIGKLCVASLSSSLGTTALAANAVVNTISTFLNIPANSISLAAPPIVGRCLGAGDQEEAFRWTKRLLFMAYIGCWASNLTALLFLDRFMIGFFHLSPEAFRLALQVMMLFNVVSLFDWPTSFTLPKLLHAGGDSRYTMKVSIFSMWTFRVVLCYLLVLKFHMGLFGIWIGMYVDWFFRSLFFTIRLFSRKWMEHKLI